MLVLRPRQAVLGVEPTWAKAVTVVDEDVDIYDMNDVMWAVLIRSRPDRDTIIIPYRALTPSTSLPISTVGRGKQTRGATPVAVVSAG